MIVVTTPTGRIGRQVLDTLLDGPEAIRVITRDPARLSPHVRERVEVVPGSHHDSDVVTTAFAGVDCVFWLVPPNPRAEHPVDYYLEFTRPACEAITRHGVRRVVGVSSLGREYGHHAGHLSAAFAMDALIEATQVGYRALRPPFFLENLLSQAQMIRNQGVFALANSRDRPLRTVAARDIAATAAALLLDASWSGQDGVPLIGPDDLSPDNMAQVMSEVLDRPVRFQQISTAEYKAMALTRGASEGSAQGLVDMAMAQNDGIYNGGSPAPERTATSFHQWCVNVLRPAVLA
ncbi:NAD(P)H-binding protein [Streptomyces silvisoli]|uniref:NAD(P)H-binding protein n=1 Tax=Streptomyces silvisoli TaxID=3034235 RepID=A0ABT5ZKM1_9ACTN|nr:NAD(P)H-binding protein [Streptomyces silvisoli]MDF3290139.1 NAD(P)H-binding protein [Streptomyces silvisoli]